ncbi:polyadenylate-binding protein-interacting protein 2B [Agrilus planipennis]|uniref:Polyadenylate-binding protein-interacting protein 2B n=1 Tax=Agrilus planipennis TaxID=224129 RepID=A0A1W4WRP3_AGRPL|nr:polyadenylate-binding protein-interacting protein 2B [Agrilus planipennis]XP_018322695.1 polyadenylate-binding protein-interacting protein 2B [Agrilus planipennis]
MKMPTNKPVGNGYYGYEEITYYSDGSATEEIEQSVGYQEENNSGADDDFSEYLWMENEEEFDKEVMQQLEEQELMEQCLEAMLEDERINNQCPNRPEIELLNMVNNLKIDFVEVAKGSTLNPLAAEFIPDGYINSATATAGSS